MTEHFTTALKNFHLYCLGSTNQFSLPVFEVATVEDLQAHTKALHALQSALRASGKEAVLISHKGKYVSLTHSGFTLRVQTQKVTKRTNVAATSINSYHSQDFSTQALRIARYIFDASILDGDITRAEIASYLSIQEGRVSARVFALLKQYKDGGYTDKSGEYRLALTAPRLSRCEGASKVPNEAMRFEKLEPLKTTLF